jgi:hypothetical protein
MDIVNMRVEGDTVKVVGKIEDKKVRVSITINPEIEQMIKQKHINLSSLVNKLLSDFFNDENM